MSWSDPGYLRDVQYRTDGNLAARQSIYAYQHPPGDLVAVALDRAALRGDETVVDVGCGNGRYLAALVDRLDLVAELRVPDAGPIEAYARSIPGPARATALPPGPYRIRTHTGVLVGGRVHTAAPSS